MGLVCFVFLLGSVWDIFLDKRYEGRRCKEICSRNNYRFVIRWGVVLKEFRGVLVKILNCIMYFWA